MGGGRARGEDKRVGIREIELLRTFAKRWQAGGPIIPGDFATRINDTAISPRRVRCPASQNPICALFFGRPRKILRHLDEGDNPIFSAGLWTLGRDSVARRLNIRSKKLTKDDDFTDPQGC